MKRRAVSIIELSIGIALLIILASQVALSTNLSIHTAKHEAERLAKELSSLRLKADKTKTPFTITLESDKMKIQWNTSNTSQLYKINIEDFPASSGCKYSWNGSISSLTYRPTKNNFHPGGTIKIEGNGEPYYVIIAVIGGRVRISDTPPETN